MFKNLKHLFISSWMYIKNIKWINKIQAENLGLHVEGSRIKDNDGRERIFHGTNVVEKRFPFVPVTDSFNAKDSFSKEDA